MISFSKRMPCLLAAVAFALPLVARAAPAQEILFDQVPEAAVAAAVVRHSGLALFKQMYTSNPQLKQDLGAFLTRRLGVDLTNLDGVAAWSTHLQPKTTWALVLRIPGAAGLKGTKQGSFDGTDLIALGPEVVAASVPGGLLVGSAEEVRVGIAVAHKKAPGISSRSSLGQVAAADHTADLVAGLSVAALTDPQVQAMAQQYGVRLATLTFRNVGQIVLELIGDGQKLRQAQALMNNGMNVLLAQLKTARDSALQNDKIELFEGIGTISAYDQLASFWKEFAPKLQGDRLVSAYQMPELKTAGTLVPMIGIAAAVAVPAFTKYLRRAKTVEATVNLRRILDGATAYAVARGPIGPKFTFPASTPWTPARGCCGQRDNKCAPDPAAFSAPTWKALNFSVDEPHYYQYRVTSQGKGKNATLTVEARGDLDCNGKAATFRRTLKVFPDSSVAPGELETENESE